MRYSHQDTPAKRDLKTDTEANSHSSIAPKKFSTGINSATPDDWDRLKAQYPAFDNEPSDDDAFHAVRELLEKRFQSMDAVNEERSDVFQPSHYVKDGGVECIDVMAMLFGEERVKEWAEITAFKYQWRQGSKAGNSATKDKMKSIWYTRFSMGDDPRND